MKGWGQGLLPKRDFSTSSRESEMKRPTQEPEMSLQCGKTIGLSDALAAGVALRLVGAGPFQA